ncbi:MAG TPA: non-ribosomal peptide synthetase, partial [Myxococcaceae bacterium]
VFHHGERSVDFAWLEAQANRLAHRLRAAGVTRGARVGIATGRSPELGVGALAVLKLGAAYVALDPSYPRARLLSIVKNADLAAVVTTRLSEPLAAAFGVPTVVLDEQGSGEDLFATAPLSVARPDDVAYLIYTSGSTGGPKGVLGLHRGMVNRIAWMLRRHPVTEDDVFCLKTSPHFVDSIAELFTPLVAGAPTIILDDATVQTPARLLSVLAEQRVTRLIVVPSLLRVMLDTLEAGGPRPERLRYLVSSGEALRTDLARRCLRLLPGCTLINLYGTSEASADSTFHEVRDPEDEALQAVTVPIGRPIANTRVYILDGQRHPCPEGVPGELFLAGDGLAAGYHAMPGVTSERFVELIFPDGTRERAYRTGDIGRRRADGAIEYLGRNDQQVKVRGQRVELAEIDAWLEQHPAVREAITLTEPSPSGEPVLASFAVATGAVPRGEEVLQFLAERLPTAMVPARIAWVQEIPRLPNGKVDRQQLRAAPLTLTEPPRAEQSPASDGQHFIAALWRSLLGVDSIDARDTLFGLGGHSLLAMQFVAEVERQKGVRLDPNHALTRSLEFLAARIDRERIGS